MKRIVPILAAVLVWAGCSHIIGGDVTFEWFNLSTNQIWVTDIAGLPPEASAGRLMPSRAEDQLEVAASVFSEPVRVKNRIKITWKDGGAEGWPGGLKRGELVPPGTPHEAEFNREALGIPAKLENGRIRFTYLGTNTWRVRLITTRGWK
jgi:hypothetical protein